MKKIFFYILIFIFLSVISFVIILSTFGIETNKFNNLISQKLNDSDNNINIELSTIKFKIDLKELSLFLETKDPLLDYRKAKIPAKNLRVYINFLSIIKSDINIQKVNLQLNQLDLQNLKKLSYILKPSNLTSFLNNKVEKGKLNTEIEIYLNEDNLIENFIAKGSVVDLKAKVIDGIEIDKTNFTFFADQTDILLKNILSKNEFFEIYDGDLKLSLSPEISLQTNFKTIVEVENKANNYFDIFTKIESLRDINYLKAELNNFITLNFDKTYKVKKYNYRSSGKVLDMSFIFSKPFENTFLNKKVNQILLKDTKFEADFDLEKNKINFDGKYAFDEKNFLNFNLANIIKDNIFQLKLNADYEEAINFDLINYHKPKGINSNLSLDLKKEKNKIEFNEINYKEEKNSILIKNLIFHKKKFHSLDKISIKTYDNDEKNNDFKILFKKIISIKGNQFDARNLPKILNNKESENRFSNLNTQIDIDLSNIIAPVSEKIKNFKLIGNIENGKFSKISSKGDFGNNNFLDISMKNDKNNNKRYLEVYSDLTKPLLTEYSFFKGLTGGKLLYSSVIDKNSSNSKLKIENFKVINAPGMVKLLSLADLGGLADLAKGDGITFESLDITMEKSDEKLQINEILAIGPSISVLMEGYQDVNVTSLRGTLIPAKTLNRMISKIPLIGDIVIPKEVGEGLFGISFKIKGPPGKTKTTINPIRTITP
ncbi:MAG: hypothetical protein VXW09_01050, partial [Pseudomonadota bacterium]|nr:hypothetical protein [Pseudomonadota bacterium]